MEPKHQGNGHGLRAWRTGLLKDEGWSQRQTQSSYWATGMNTEKGPISILWEVVCVLRLYACRERPLAEIRVAQDGVGRWASSWGLRVVSGRSGSVGCTQFESI